MHFAWLSCSPVVMGRARLMVGQFLTLRQLVFRSGYNLQDMSKGFGEITVSVETASEIGGIWLKSIFIA